MKIFVVILSLFFLSGCYQASLAPMLGPAATASQGNLAYSAASTGLSYGVKHKTGKYPVEHLFQREKQSCYLNPLSKLAYLCGGSLESIWLREAS